MAATKGQSVEEYLRAVLRENLPEEPASSFLRLIERAKNEDWHSDGTFLTREEIYDRP